MLSLLVPEVVPLVRELPHGLLPLWLKGDPVPKLVVKAPKETILTARMNRGFDIYLVPYRVDTISSVGFIAAFFDDHDEPLVAGGALMADLHGEDFRRLLLSNQVEIHFFDELSREMLGYRSKLTISNRYRQVLASAEFPNVADLNQGAALDVIRHWFSARRPIDDAEAIHVDFETSLFPDDILYLDTRTESMGYQGSKKLLHSELERSEPGEFQERDILSLLQRTFAPEQIYWAPKRIHDQEEIVDILIATSRSIVLVQAKDSPNIERIMRAPIARKRAATNGALRKGIRQIRGALGYLKRASPMRALLNGKEIDIDWDGKQLYALVVVKELFDDDFDVYTPELLDVRRTTGVPCITLAYNELHQYTTHLRGEDAFCAAFMRVFNHGVETGMFPRLRVHPPKQHG